MSQGYSQAISPKSQEVNEEDQLALAIAQSLEDAQSKLKDQEALAVAQSLEEAKKKE